MKRNGKKKKQKKNLKQGQGRHVGTMLFWPEHVCAYVCVYVRAFVCACMCVCARHDTHLSLQLSHYCQASQK